MNGAAASAVARGEAQAWFPGRHAALPIPAHAEALREGGAAFLTAAFRSSGALAADNAVRRITEFEDCPGGSTGRKLLLSVEYERRQAGLHTELFVKFSRDLDDPIRDLGRTQMEPEVRFARLSRMAGFPIAVPACYHADYHAASGTGVLITERIAFGRDGVEAHHVKCRDQGLPDALAHYQALITALARLAGAHKAGQLAADVSAQFPFDPAKLTVGHRAPYTARQLQNRVARYAEFAATHPRLLPANVRDAAFIARLREQVARFPEHETAIQRELQCRPDYVALCHWNANIDNAWFWRGADGRLECGLMDWGCASQMNVAMALWGAMSAAETTLWDQHLDALLDVFIAEFRRSGGPALEATVLKRELLLYAAIMGLAWLLDAPPYIRALVPLLDDVHDRLDPRIQDNETARVQLQMLTNFLNLWQRHDFGRVLDEFLADTGRR